jgi:acetyltransferase-like isoleucine patch superfamily enzyme
VVGEGCKIDGGTVIAHNARIGPGCVIGWGVWVASVQMSAGCWVAPGACVREGLRIGAGAIIGMGAVVTKDVPEGATVHGVPARKVDPAADSRQHADGGRASG